MMRALLTAILAGCGLWVPVAAAQTELPKIDVVDTRLGAGITGASTTIITAADIERSPQLTLPDILAREAGIQVSTLFGGVNGATTTVDMRGFGVTGASNTLILINGRRLNDWDLPGFDLSTIGRDSIERIEITRGNSGAVLYGDGAVGGVINIVTKSAVGQKPAARVEGGYGSFRAQEGVFSVSGANGPWSVGIYGNALGTDGYRQNNALRQNNIVGDFRYAIDQGSLFLNVGADDQRMRLPGARSIIPGFGIDEYATDPRGTSTPLNYADKQGLRVTGGFSRMLAQGIELILDGGVRQKLQQAGYFQLFGEAYVDTTLTTASATPRLNITRDVFGLPSRIITGLDFYRTQYHSGRSFAQGLAAIHQYSARQDMAAAYWQQTISVMPATDLSYGGRLQYNATSVRDIYDPTAPQRPGFVFPQGVPLDNDETNYAAHAGFEHRFTPALSAFGRVARSFRVPNVDERIGNAPITFPLPAPTFDLKTQTSHDYEVGAKLRAGYLTVQTSVYQMDLKNELHLNPVTFANTNFDPTRRRGVETIATWAIADNLRLKGNLTYTDARYRDGPFAGKAVPVVSRWTGSGAVSWDIVEKYLTLDTIVRFASRRFLDNDEANRGTLMIPAQTVVDLRLAGAIERFYWSFAVQNLFDLKYFDYGLDTSFGPFLSYDVYPLPGRTFMLRAGINY
jgi:iron complex outermembrane receptor protein